MATAMVLGRMDDASPDAVPIDDPPGGEPADTLAAFAAVNDAAAGTTKKLSKQRIIAEYLRALTSDADARVAPDANPQTDASAETDQTLRTAVRCLVGRPFPATSERVTGVSGATVADVMTGLFGLSGEGWHASVVRRGEVGEAMAEQWRQTGRAPGSPLDAPRLRLGDLASAFDRLADARGFAEKRAVLRDLFARIVTPREAAYVGKVLFGDLRTGVREGVLEAAIAEAYGRNPSAVRRATLLIGDLDEVAVLAQHDRLGTATFRPFHPVQFMLATPQATPADAARTITGRDGGGDTTVVIPYDAEDKLDGIRAQVHKSGVGDSVRVEIYTRTLDRIDHAFPEVAAAAARLPGEFLLDGEIVPWRDGRVLPFARIQKRLGRKAPSEKVLADFPCVFVAFDMLYRDGVTWMDRPLTERRAALGTLRDAGLLTLDVTPVADEAHIVAAFDAARARRNEGLILKHPSSAYVPGRRGQAWLKLKTHLPTLDCVVTAAERGHGKRRDSLSDYTFAVWDREPTQPDARLVNVGKAFSGVTDEEIARLTAHFEATTLSRHGRVQVVTPTVVLEIATDTIQVSKRHAGGFALRFPRIKRIRWDKRPEDADRLARVREIYAASANFAHAGAGEPSTPAHADNLTPGLFDGW